MRTRSLASIAMMLGFLGGTVFPQSNPQKSSDETPIRISTELIQLDVVITDKNGKLVKGLSKDDFEVYESGKKQHISFFEFVEGSAKPGPGVAPGAPKPVAEADRKSELTEKEVRRIFAFVVDDLTISNQDLSYIRRLLTGFVNDRMQPGDLVAIVRVVGGRGLLQQFTSDKELLRRAIASLRPVTHPLGIIGNAAPERISGQPQEAEDAFGGLTERQQAQDGNRTLNAEADLLLNPQEFGNAIDDSNTLVRARMTLGTTSFIIDMMKLLPGRKTLVLISGGLQILTKDLGSASLNVSQYVNELSDKATRAGVAINTLDVRGMSAHIPIARFADSPGKSMIPLANDQMMEQSKTFGRTADEALLGNKDVLEDQLGLRALASATGGLAIMNTNNFDKGLEKIVESAAGYYLLAYSPTNPNFDGKFRKVEIKVKRDGLKVLSRDGYIAKAETAVSTPPTRDEELLQAVKSPLTRRDLDLEWMLVYKLADASKGALDMSVAVYPKGLSFEQVADKQQTSFDVAGFVFDEFGKLRGGFSETINAKLSADEYTRAAHGGLSYSANTVLSPGSYQVRLVVRDNKSGNLGTLSRYVEVPDISKGRLSASSLLLASAPASDTKATSPVPLAANRLISRKQDLRYAVFIYGPKLKGGKPEVETQVFIVQNGKVIYQQPAEPVPSGSNSSQLVKVGQLGLAGVKPGRYTMIVTITDRLADKKSQTLTRSMDFVVN